MKSFRFIDKSGPRSVRLQWEVSDAPDAVVEVTQFLDSDDKWGEPRATIRKLRTREDFDGEDIIEAFRDTLADVAAWMKELRRLRGRRHVPLPNTFKAPEFKMEFVHAPWVDRVGSL